MNWSFDSSRAAGCFAGRLLLLTFVLIATRGSAATGAAQATWWKGNLHTHSLWSDGDDYPDYVIPLAQAVVAGKVERGVAICGSGVGAAVCANKVRGIRAALIHDHFSARQGVEDDHMNILCMGGRTVGPAVAWDLVQTFLEAKFSQAERHLRRLGKVASLEIGKK